MAGCIDNLVALSVQRRHDGGALAARLQAAKEQHERAKRQHKNACWSHGHEYSRPLPYFMPNRAMHPSTTAGGESAEARASAAEQLLHLTIKVSMATDAETAMMETR